MLVFKPSVSEIAIDLVAGAIDATILWDQSASSIASIEGVRVAGLDKYASVAEIGVLSSSENTEEAAKFAAYLTQMGRARLLEAGFRIPAGSTP